MYTFRNYLDEVNSESQSNRYYEWDAVEVDTSFLLMLLEETTSQL